ncbi:nuclear transport factor 2 family protein [Aquisalimonas sp.]|uniref:nuclear transport factor 2 family protein n=1 Tax=Aquisalimonas sp. TaxID=1872621 RepID=UPI0025BE66F8|nr:nuclear transport factor 2 family protein [Aquisalimonas sp.]
MTDNTTHDEVTIDFLERFLEGWNRHDLDGILQMLNRDCLYITGSGDRFQGHDEIREGLAGFLETFPDAHWYEARHFVSSDRGASEWIFTATGSDGTRFELDSCDLFTFRNGRISVVSAYRRERRV